MFPVINCLDDLLPHIKDYPEIRVMKDINTGFTIVCYMISAESTFDGPGAEYRRECRGITFDSEGNTIARPFEKFFNVGERPDTQVDTLNWKHVSLKMDKRDGSMITPVLLNGTIVCKSKKAFTSDVAVNATKHLYKPENIELIKFIKFLLERNLCPCFEWTSPGARIVLNYTDDSLTLLCVRDMFTGEYYDIKDFKVQTDLGIKIVDTYDHKNFNITEVQEYLATAEGIEGYVVQFNDGAGNVKHAKLKGAWYLLWHHSVTFPTWRSLAQMVIAEEVDDYKSYLTSVNASHDNVVQVEKLIVSTMVNIENELTKIFEVDGELPRKDFAIKYTSTPYFGLLMSKYSGKEPDVKGYFVKHLLKEMFSTEQVPSDSLQPLEDN